MSSEAGDSRQPSEAVGVDGYQGTLFIISSPSGGGKGTLIKYVLDTVQGIGYSVSWTTRAARPGEINGVNYHFVSIEDFEKMREHGGFLEWAFVHDNYYATVRNVVEREMSEGRDIILEIDVQGAASVRRLIPSAVGVFILPPSFEVLRERLFTRQTESAESIALRLHNARGEVEHYPEFDYVIINDDAARAAAQLASIVYAERARRERQEWIARRVLASFPES